jgi:hypothetical protein
MQKSSLKLYLVTFLFTLLLVSSAFAGDGQCPLTDPPPPPPGEGRGVSATDNTNPAETIGYQFLQGFWEILAQSADISK